MRRSALPLIATLLFLGNFFLFAEVIRAQVCVCYNNANECASTSSAVSASNCESICMDMLETDFQASDYEPDGDQDAEDALAEACSAVPFGSATTGATTDTEKTYLSPVLSVNIPDVSFSQVAENSGTLEINFIGEYISGVYKYLVGIAATLATVMVIIAGAQYVAAAGGSAEMGKAKERIKNAVTGFVLLMFVVLLLYVVNPRLTFFEGLQIEQIDPIAFLEDNFDTSGSVTTTGVEEIPEIICPKQAGTASVYDIANSFNGRTAYRFGGKGGPPPYDAETKTSPDGTPYKNFCPEGNVCLDCSGFVGMIRSCAGLPAVSDGTAQIFANAEQITSCIGTNVNGTELVPGDLIGWKAGDDKKGGGTQSFGHVYIYIGEGKVADSHGSGRAAGTAIGIYPVSSVCSRSILRVVRVSS
jgi:cell wall-associated NlpC family hydrolase